MHRLLGRGLVLLVLMTAVILISGCTANDAAGIGLTPAATLTPLTENLTFKGDISGTLTTGIDARLLNHDNPTSDAAPRFTQCSTFASLPGSDTIDDYVAVIVGTVDGKRYAVTVEINMDDPAYTKPGTQLLPGDTNMGGGIQVYEVGGQNRSWIQVFGPALQEPAVIVLHPDRKSGTVDAWLASSNQSQLDATATLHLQGGWRCG